MTGGVVLAGPAWSWADAVFAAVLAVGLSAMACLAAARVRRMSAAGPAVGSALVLALSGTVFSQGLPLVRVVVGAVVVAAAVAAAVAHRCRAPRARCVGRNVIARPIRR